MLFLHYKRINNKIVGGNLLWIPTNQKKPSLWTDCSLVFKAGADKSAAVSSACTTSTTVP